MAFLRCLCPIRICIMRFDDRKSVRIGGLHVQGCTPSAGEMPRPCRETTMMPPSPLSRFSARRLRRTRCLLYVAFVSVTAAFSASCAFSQQLETAAASIPDAPAPQQTGAPAPQGGSGQSDATGPNPEQTKRILGIMPNFRAVSADEKLPPQTVKEKFDGTLQENFDYSSFIFSGILAGVAQAQDSYPEFHQGAAGYGRYYWHTFADQADENFWVQFILPAALHEDSRYYTLGHGSIAHRALYAFGRTLITRNDDGGETLNISEVVGAGAASGISNLYYPEPERTWTKTGQRWLTNVIIDGGTYVFQEFWPDLNNAVFHQQD